jgi:hypothetical protein
MLLTSTNPRTWLALLSAASTIAGVVIGMKHNKPHHTPSRRVFDRNIPLEDLSDGSFPASDPPSSIPCASAA